MSSQDHSSSSALLTFRRPRSPPLRVDLDVLPLPNSPPEHSWYTTARSASRQTKRPRTAPQSSSRSSSPLFHDRIKDIHDQLPSITQDLEHHADPSDRITWIFDRRPVVSPPIKQIGFLNRSPKIMETGSNTSPDSPLIPLPLRRLNVPPLHSYKEPSIAQSREPFTESVTYPHIRTPQSAKSGSEVESMQRRKSHRRQDTPPLLFGKRPSTAPSYELGPPKRRRDGFLDLDREEGQAVIPSFLNTESVSQISLCTPVTASTFPSDSMSSLPIHDYTFDDSNPSPPKKTRSLWRGRSFLRTNTESPIVTEDSCAPPPAPRHLRTMVSSPHVGVSTSPLKLELRVAADGIRSRDRGGKEKHERGTTLRKDSTVKRVWKSLVGRAHW